MSKCSKKIKELKEKIDCVSGLDDDFVFMILCSIEKRINLIANYAEEDDLNGTCFNKNTQTADIKEDIKILTDYMLELNDDIQRAEEWANTSAEEEMYFALKNVLDKLNQLQKENEELKITVERKNRLLYERI